MPFFFGGFFPFWGLKEAGWLLLYLLSILFKSNRWLGLQREKIFYQAFFTFFHYIFSYIFITQTSLLILMKIKMEKGHGPSMGFPCFFCALLSKTSVCTLPAVILLIYWWKQNCIRKKIFLMMIPFGGNIFILLHFYY